MPYSIKEAREGARRDVKRVDEIAEHYPDAWQSELPDGRRAWVVDAEDLKANGVELIADPKEGRVYFCPYHEKGDLWRVYTDHWGWRYGFDVLDRLDTDTKAKLLAVVMRKR